MEKTFKRENLENLPCSERLKMFHLPSFMRWLREVINEASTLRTGCPVLEGLFVQQPKKKTASSKSEEFEWEIRQHALQ